MRDFDALVELLGAGDDDTVELASRALVRIGPAVAVRAIARAEGAPPRLRARLVRVVGRLDAPDAGAFVLVAARDEDEQTRRYALAALGRAIGPARGAAEEALLEAWGRETSAPVLRTVAQSLGKMGSPRALEALRARPPHLPGGADAELDKKVARASQMLARDAAREGESTRGAIDPAGAAREPLPILFFCREGLQPICAEELGRAWSAVVARPGEVRGVLRGALSRVFASRTMTHVGFPLPPVETRGDLADAVARALTGDAARAVFAAFSRGSHVRYRLAFEHGGHQRALVWRIAELVQARDAKLVNDPRESTWHAVVRTQVLARPGAPHEERVEVILVPRALDDPRFTYRAAEVPAASHPTIAAALAFVGGAREDDVVWDPFVGSGLELVERARLGPYARLLGTDRDPRALAAARANLAEARVTAELEEHDSLAARPRGVTLILTNPPMGRRVSTASERARDGRAEGARGERGDKSGELVVFLERFVAHAARVLTPGGRLAWISPRAALTRARAKRERLALERAQPMLMGGFEAELQVFTKR